MWTRIICLDEEEEEEEVRIWRLFRSSAHQVFSCPSVKGRFSSLLLDLWTMAGFSGSADFI